MAQTGDRTTSGTQSKAPQETRQAPGPREASSETPGRRQGDGETGMGPACSSSWGWGHQGLPQMMVGGLSGTITSNPAKTRRQVACGWVSHRDSPPP